MSEEAVQETLNAGLATQSQADSNGLVCFTNCLLPLEDGSLVNRDLWIDQREGVILDANYTFFHKKLRPDTTIDLQGNILSPGLIDIQINGGYGFDFSVHDGDDEKYRANVKMLSSKIVETGVTSLVPTVITQEKQLYPKLLSLLQPYSAVSPPDGPGGANILGWHAEGPFLQEEKRGAHTPAHLLAATEMFESFTQVYGEANLAPKAEWEAAVGAGATNCAGGVRIITAAPEVAGVMETVAELNSRGILFSVGHSIASSAVATRAIQNGARLITHLFNAMPQLHHRDPSIIGLLGASPHLSSSSPTSTEFGFSTPLTPSTHAILGGKIVEEATILDESITPLAIATPPNGLVNGQATIKAIAKLNGIGKDHKRSRSELHLDYGQVADMDFERPFYGLIVDGIHSHPNSVRLAYSAHRDGCVLITDAMMMLDPHMRDGEYDWRGKKLIKAGLRLYIEGTSTLAGSVVTLDACVRNFSRFTGCSLGEAIRCATFNPAKCLNIEDKKGTLRPGADADLVIFDLQGKVLSTWVKGQKVWDHASVHD